jgi:hypothetical protein
LHGQEGKNMANERITEDIVRNHFKYDPLFKSIKLEEQKSYNKRVLNLLQTASKSGKDVGKPEFIRYAGSEQSQGLVLTPAHITDLFCDLANLNVNDIIYDPCCGTGGFLIAGMKRMFELAGNDESKKQNIKTIN